MRKRVIGLLALVLCAACNRVGTAPIAAQITTPQLIAGTGDISQPRFAGNGGPYLTVTDSGQPNLVFLVTATTLEVQPVSFRKPPTGAPPTPTAVGEVVRDAFVVPNDDSSGGSVAGTKGFAAFVSQASNLLDPGTGIAFFRDSTQAFVKDVATGENVLASVGLDGTPANAEVTAAVISGGGRFVAFATAATNLVDPGNPQLAPNGASQIYVLDLMTREIELVSKTPGNAPGSGNSSEPAISPDGRFVAFRSLAPDLVGGDTNGTADILVYDRSRLVMARISVDPGNVENYVDSSEPVLSEDARSIAFTAMPLGGGPRQVFLRNPNGTITAITPLANGDCDSPSVTPDGRFVAFASAASNLVPGDTEGFTDVFVFDATSGMLARASVDVNGSGAGGNGDSGEPTLSADGNYIAYVSRATNVTVPDSTRPDSNPNGLLDLVLAVQPFGNP